MHKDEWPAEEVDELLLQREAVDGAAPAAVADQVAHHPQVDEGPRRQRET